MCVRACVCVCVSLRERLRDERNRRIEMRRKLIFCGLSVCFWFVLLVHLCLLSPLDSIVSDKSDMFSFRNDMWSSVSGVPFFISLKCGGRRLAIFAQAIFCDCVAITARTLDLLPW